MKRIENRKLYQISNFYKRYFDIKFDRGIILIKQNVFDDSIHNKIASNIMLIFNIKIDFKII